MLLNAVRGHLAEFGIITPQGPLRALELISQLREGAHAELSDIARIAMLGIGTRLDALARQMQALGRQLPARHRQDKVSCRLETIPRVGILTATALATSVPDPSVFRSGRQFAAFLGLTPRQDSSGGKEKVGRISNMGDGYLRRLLVVGALSVIRGADANSSATGAWLRSLLATKSKRLTTVAMANKTARIA